MFDFQSMFNTIFPAKYLNKHLRMIIVVGSVAQRGTQSLLLLFFFFIQKIRLDISRVQTILVKCRVLFSKKVRKIFTNVIC